MDNIMSVSEPHIRVRLLCAWLLYHHRHHDCPAFSIFLFWNLITSLWCCKSTIFGMHSIFSLAWYLNQLFFCRPFIVSTDFCGHAGATSWPGRLAGRWPLARTGEAFTALSSVSVCVGIRQDSDAKHFTSLQLITWRHHRLFSSKISQEVIVIP